MAGVWAEDLQRGLLWRGVVPESYHGLCPSWSWAGADFNEGFGRVYEVSRFMRYGNDFAAELIGFSEPKTADVFLGGGAATILTLRGWCKGIREFIAGNKLFSIWGTRRLAHSLDTPGLTTLELRSSPYSEPENTVLICPDKKFDVATAAVTLAEKKAVVLRISDFETWDAGSHMSTFGLLLEPTGRPDGSYRRIGLVTIPSRIPAASIDGFDLRTIRIA
jgi:hypothetical protein